MNFVYCFLSTLIIFYIVFGFTTVGMNKAIFKQAGMGSNILISILSFLIWPFFIKTTIEGYKGVVIHQIAEQAAALYNNSHAGDMLGGLAGAMGNNGFDPDNFPKSEDIVDEATSNDNIQQP